MYFITGIESFDPLLMENNVPDYRCFGYTDNFNDANYIVCTNHMNINDSYYEYVVIELIEKGIYKSVLREFWYEFDENSNMYRLIEKPEEAKDYWNFSIG